MADVNEIRKCLKVIGINKNIDWLANNIYFFLYICSCVYLEIHMTKEKYITEILLLDDEHLKELVKDMQVMTS